ncbi:MAG: sugar phosphate isomerase/epimerase [Verrucomicrobiales bacterium]|nr:sugar phosphate isomerase/epimerase [Verrucomicrobiales bacterium]
MKLELFKTLWGHEGTLTEAITLCHEAGFSGIESPVPPDPGERKGFAAALEADNLGLIAEISTLTPAGLYVPLPHHSPQEHLDSLKEEIENALPACPRFINTMAGYDGWSFTEAMEFYAAVPALESEFDIPVSVETHRGRYFNSPWRVRDVLKEIPDLKITCDFSHFCVVTERLVLEEEPEILSLCASHAYHMHTRVGYSQGPQVTDPRAPESLEALLAHERWWDTIWNSQTERGFEVSTMTPEFGPDGYLHTLPFTEEPLGDLWEINAWIAHRQRDRFSETYSTKTLS